MKKFYDIEIDSQVELENGKTLGKLEESKISVNDGNCSSGGWPADLPKPSVGGYGYTDSVALDERAVHKINEKYLPEGGFGYTEQGNQTVITWDGDTEGRETIYIEEDGERIDLNYKVSDLTFTSDSVIGGKMTFNNAEYDISDINIVNNDSDGYTSSTAEFTAVLLDTFAVISCSASGVIRFTEDGETIEFHCPDTGIYFVNAGGNYFVSSLTYGTPDTIHKIDEKYLPASGGAMVVTYTLSDGGDTFIADKTFVEIVTAMQNGGIVVGIWDFDGEKIPLGCLTGMMASGTVLSYVMTEIDGDNYVVKPVIVYDEGEWKFNE